MNRPGSAGYSLVAVLLGIALTSIALVSTGRLIDLGTRRSAGPEIEMQTLAVAEALLEEIVSLPLRDPDDAQLCGTAEPARALYDDVCDFRDFNRAVADGLLVGAAGPAAFAVQVAVTTSALAGFHPCLLYTSDAADAAVEHQAPGTEAQLQVLGGSVGVQRPAVGIEYALMRTDAVRKHRRMLLQPGAAGVRRGQRRGRALRCAAGVLGAQDTILDVNADFAAFGHGPAAAMTQHVGRGIEPQCIVGCDGGAVLKQDHAQGGGDGDDQHEFHQGESALSNGGVHVCAKRAAPAAGGVDAGPQIRTLLLSLLSGRT